MNKRTLIIIVVAAAIVVTTGGTAFAKGPESATLIGPDLEQPIELKNDPDLGRLIQQSGIWAGISGRRIPIEPTGDLGPAYTLTWINSGPPEAPVEERTIRQFLYPYAEPGPVIHTPEQVGLEGWGGDVVGWFMAPEDLTDTLVALGVPVSAPPPTIDLQTPDEVATAAPVESAARPATDYFGYLAILGLGLVIALTWAARRRASA